MPRGRRAGESCKWQDLRDAITAMQAGDPPLRWTIDKERHRSMSVSVSNWTRYVGMRVRTFYADGDLWIVRLPAPEQERAL